MSPAGPAPVDTSVAYASEVVRLLWPEPWGTPYVVRGRRRDAGGASHRDAYLFPSPRRPRLLVPTDVPAAAGMLQRLGKGRARLAGPARDVLERTVRSRAFALAGWPVLRVPAPPAGAAADSIERYLAGCLGREVRVGVLLGTRRANQKPVLQVLGPGGVVLGFAKVGHTELTAALVRGEAASLARVADLGPRSFRVPRVLHHGRWAGLEVLVLSPVATDPRPPVTEAARLTAMRELMHLGGAHEATLADSGFWARLRGSVDRLATGPDGVRLWAVAEGLEAAHGADRVRLGGWHGDWGHWNMAAGAGGLHVWDWERYDPEVPLGFDGLHFAAQRVRAGEPDEIERQKAFLRAVPTILSALGVPPDRHDLTLRLYLLEIAVRYLDALTHGSTPALRRRTSWVLALAEQAGAPRPDAPGPAARSATTRGRP